MEKPLTAGIPFQKKMGLRRTENGKNVTLLRVYLANLGHQRERRTVP